MLNSGKKLIDILTLVLSKKKISERNKINITPFKLNGRSLRVVDFVSVSTICQLEFLFRRFGIFVFFIFIPKLVQLYRDCQV